MLYTCSIFILIMQKVDKIKIDSIIPDLDSLENLMAVMDFSHDVNTSFFSTLYEGFTKWIKCAMIVVARVEYTTRGEWGHAGVALAAKNILSKPYASLTDNEKFRVNEFLAKLGGGLLAAKSK